MKKSVVTLPGLILAFGVSSMGWAQITPQVARAALGAGAHLGGSKAGVAAPPSAHLSTKTGAHLNAPSGKTTESTDGQIKSSDASAAAHLSNYGGAHLQGASGNSATTDSVHDQYLPGVSRDPGGGGKLQQGLGQAGA